MTHREAVATPATAFAGAAPGLRRARSRLVDFPGGRCGRIAHDIAPGQFRRDVTDFRRIRCEPGSRETFSTCSPRRRSG